VFGKAAEEKPIVSGGGSGAVQGPYVISGLQGIRERCGLTHGLSECIVTLSLTHCALTVLSLCSHCTLTVLSLHSHCTLNAGANGACNVTYSIGEGTPAAIAAATTIATEADVAIVFAGVTSTEGVDRKVVISLHSRCTLAVLSLHSRCTFTVLTALSLHSHCTHCTHCTLIVLLIERLSHSLNRRMS
jgi:hypothetical protein